MANIEPMFDWVIVKKDEEKQTSNGGIFIPDSVKEKPSTGTVVSVGQGAWDDKSNTYKPMLLKEGDKVLFPKLMGKTIKLDDEEVFLIKQEEILARIH